MVVGIGVTPPLHAQVRVPARAPAAPQLEGRLDAALSPRTGLLGGVGLNVRAGWYARLGVAASAGATRRDGGWESVQRIDASVRFLMDPFGESARGVYGGAGLGLQRDAGGDVQGRLLLLLGLEGARTRRLVPAFELTLGGGVRAGVVLRARRRNGR